MSVYFAQVGHYVKVGYSANPERRVRRLFSSATNPPADAPRDLASRHLIRAIEGGYRDEQEIHRALSDFCVGSEWYVDEPEVRAFVATVERSDAYAKVERPVGPVELAYDAEGDRLAAEAYGRVMAAASTP